MKIKKLQRPNIIYKMLQIKLKIKNDIYIDKIHYLSKTKETNKITNID